LPQDRPRNRRELWWWIKLVLGYGIAWRPVCEEHCAPFDLVADAYFGKFDFAVAEGARRTGKTRDLSIVHELNCHFLPRLEDAHIGGTWAQALRCYSYLQEYFVEPSLGGAVEGQGLLETTPRKLQPALAEALEGQSLMRETKWRNGSHLYVMAGTKKGVSGPHPQRAVGDEVDHWDWDVYQLFLGMPVSSDLYAAQTILTSARLTSYGTMSRILKEAEGKDVPVFRWCTLDAMRRCPDCEDASLAARGIKSDPPKCPLWNDCQGRVRRATGHIRRQDVIRSFLGSDSSTWNRQYLLKEGAPEGLVYPNWKRELNVTLDAEYKPDLPVYWACDYGVENPTAIELCQLPPDGGLHIFDYIYVRHMLVDGTLALLHQIERVEMRDEERWYVIDPDTGDTRGPYRKPAVAYVDPSAKELQGQIARLGITVSTPVYGVVDGCAIVRRLICNSSGHRSLLVHPRVKPFIDEVEFYHKKEIGGGLYAEEPAEDRGGTNPNHCLDGIRYLASETHRERPRPRAF
jgi:hypothetical protein